MGSYPARMTVIARKVNTEQPSLKLKGSPLPAGRGAGVKSAVTVTRTTAALVTS